MKFPGCWMNLDGNVIYRVVPKCACSTIGQLIYYGDHGEYFDGDIHDATTGIYKWNMSEAQPLIVDAISSGQAYVFTSVRNPYGRILSSFFDKIAGVQRNGQRYRKDLQPSLHRRYGVDVEEGFDQIKSFRRFLLFVRDTVLFRRPIPPDIHWSSMSGHISTLVQNGGVINKIVRTEFFDDDMREVVASYPKKYEPNLDPMPRFNESEGHGPKREFPIQDYFDDLSLHIMYEIYRDDFELFKYSLDPAVKAPFEDIDLDEVQARLSGK